MRTFIFQTELLSMCWVGSTELAQFVLEKWPFRVPSESVMCTASPLACRLGIMMQILCSWHWFCLSSSLSWVLICLIRVWSPSFCQRRR